MVTQSAEQGDSNKKSREELFREAIRRHATYMNFPCIAEDVWNKYLTENERIRFQSENSGSSPCKSAVGLYARAKGISFVRATIELNRRYGMTDMEYDYLCRELFHFTGERIGPFLIKCADSDRFNWDYDTGILKLDGKQIRKVKKPLNSENICRILDVFQEEDWPEKIFNPFPGVPDPDKLKDTLKSLNAGLSAIRFRTARKGKIIFREFI
ncbi:hypothetical protein Pan153_41590 [Gimesia panareensis]|uniref:Uncharacterized protein n=1 Tax=Gimesia panareensis TaxID=2527978 RepID=A0A518FT40_9PLAN|nr:hypothetical protein [Gimesia panareensis]QDV19493.1 hypothetical protein Pan153_41590 [Gimesia panareensis]